MRILAIDYGEKNAGLAVSDPMGIIAQPIGAVEPVLENFLKIINQYGIEKIIVGLPLNMNGTEGESAKKATAFAEEIRKASNVLVEMVDERLTTKQAERLMIDADVSRKKRRKSIDKISAAILLESYLLSPQSIKAGSKDPVLPVDDEPES